MSLLLLPLHNIPPPLPRLFLSSGGAITEELEEEENV